MEMVKRLHDGYLWTLTRADARVADWLLMQSPLPTFILTALYLLSVYVGPKLMNKRKAFDLSWLLVPYNLAMAMLSLYIGVELAIMSTKLQYNWLCQPVNYSWEPDHLRVASALWWYYFSKLLEFLDTVFFILRKKNNQLTFLHVYHHSTMFCLWWIGIKWVPGGSSVIGAMLNSFVHVLMYFYYGMAALGPSMQKFLWWKKYLTIIQLAQFTSALILGSHAIVRGCDFPLWMQYALVMYMASFLVLFGNFYRHAYIKRRKDLHAAKNGKAICNGATSIPNGYHSRRHLRKKKEK